MAFNIMDVYNLLKRKFSNMRIYHSQSGKFYSNNERLSLFKISQTSNINSKLKKSFIPSFNLGAQNRKLSENSIKPALPTESKSYILKNSKKTEKKFSKYNLQCVNNKIDNDSIGIGKKKLLIKSSINQRNKREEIERCISTTFNFTNQDYSNDLKLKLYFALYLIILILLIYVALEKNQRKIKDKELRKKLVKYLPLLIEGKIDEFIITMINFAKDKDNVVLREIILKLESGDLKESLLLLDVLFYHSIRKPDVYNLIKGIILNSLGNSTASLDCLILATNAKSIYIKHSAYCHYVIALKNCNKVTEAEQYIKDEKISNDDLIKCHVVYEKLIPIISTFPFKFKYSQGPVGYIRNKIYLDYNDMFAKLKKIENNYYHEHEGNVTIRVWLPDDSTKVGHASIQTDKYYISFWPTNPKIGSNNIFSDLLVDTASGWNAMHNTLWQDIYSEQRLPDARISINLNEKAINDTYEQFIKSGYNWSMMGSIFKKSQNCSGLVLSLLYKGGIENLVNINELFYIESKLSNSIFYTNIALDIVDMISVPLSIVAPPFALFPATSKIIRHTFGTGGTIFYNKIITPENINRIVTQAFLQEYDNYKILKTSAFVTNHK